MTQTMTQKRKLSKGTWALIILLIVALGTVVILSAVGIIDPGPIVSAFMYLFSWAALDPVNAALIFAGIFSLGCVVTYAFYTYFRGQKVTTVVNPYIPAGQTVAGQQQQGKETVIS